MTIEEKLLSLMAGDKTITEDKKDDKENTDEQGTGTPQEPIVSIENPIDPTIQGDQNQQVVDALGGATDASGDVDDAGNPVDMNGDVEVPEDDGVDENGKKIQEEVLDESVGEDIKKGAFHKWLGKEEDSEITDADIEKGLKSDDAHVRKMAQFAKNAKSWDHKKAKLKEEYTPSQLVEFAIEFDPSVLADREELSEEFKTKTQEIFESAVAEKVTVLVEEKTRTLEEGIEQRVETAITEKVKNLYEQIDEYFDVLSEEWMTRNELAIEASLKSELTESFINGMKQVFETHYIDLPVEKFDIVTSLEEQLTQSQETLANKDKLLAEQATQLAKFERENILNEETKGMTEIDSAKYRAVMSEHMDESLESFTKKAKLIKESLSSGKTTDSKDLNLSTQHLTEDIQVETKIETKYPQMSAYTDYINRTSKK